MAWIKCTNTKNEAVYVNLDNAVTVTRNDVAGCSDDLLDPPNNDRDFFFFFKEMLQCRPLQWLTVNS